MAGSLSQPAGITSLSHRIDGIALATNIGELLPYLRHVQPFDQMDQQMDLTQKQA